MTVLPADVTAAAATATQTGRGRRGDGKAATGFMALFAVVLTLISSFQVFTQAYVLTGGGPGNATTTMVVYLYEQGFQFYKLGLASAVAWVLFIIILVITIFQFIGQKRWVHYDQ